MTRTLAASVPREDDSRTSSGTPERIITRHQSADTVVRPPVWAKIDVESDWRGVSARGREEITVRGNGRSGMR